MYVKGGGSFSACQSHVLVLLRERERELLEPVAFQFHLKSRDQLPLKTSGRAEKSLLSLSSCEHTPILIVISPDDAVASTSIVFIIVFLTASTSKGSISDISHSKSDTVSGHGARLQNVMSASLDKSTASIDMANEDLKTMIRVQ